MSDQGYVLGSSKHEARRLGRQARLYGGVEVLRPFWADRPRLVLDVGCGSGHFTRLVAEELPQSTVLGLEIDASSLAFARSLCQAKNIHYVHGDLQKMPFETERFDLVYSRFVLIHDHDPSRALSEMARVTRPGGRVVAYDMIHDGIWFSPEKPALTTILRTTIDLLRERGAEPNQGLYLATGLMQAGLVNVEARVIPHHALATEPLFDAYRDNWIATVSSLAHTLGAHFEKDLIAAAQQELEKKTRNDFMVEITVLAQGNTPHKH